MQVEVAMGTLRVEAERLFTHEMLIELALECCWRGKDAPSCPPIASMDPGLCLSEVGRDWRSSVEEREYKVNESRGSAHCCLTVRWAT